jgi:ribonuclease Z
MLLSHYHWDHLFGLPFFRPMFIEGNRIRFYGSSVQDLQSSIEQLFVSIYSPLEGAQNVAADLEYHPVEPDGMHVAGFQVRAVEAQHTAPALAFRVELGPHSVVYTPDHAAGDTETDAKLVGLAQGANLWILDAQFTVEQLGSSQGWWHTCHVEAVRLAMEAGVETVVLFHHDPAHGDEFLDRMGREAVEVATGSSTQVLMARDGMVFDVR